MSLRFILGRAGSGKTTHCQREIKERLMQCDTGPNLILLVPEQATFHNEMTLAAELGGIMRVQVLSFRRLTYRVLQEVGGGARLHIGDLGKRMVLRRFLAQRRDQLKVFGSAADQAGFVDSLASAISELKIYQVGVDDLARLLANQQGEQSLLQAKIADLYMLYKDLEDFLAEKYLDPDDYLNLLAEKIPQSSIVQGAEIWVDGFSGFTPQELQVLAALMATARRVNVALTLPPTDDLQRVPDFFHITFETYHKLLGLAQERGIPVEDSYLLNVPHRFAANPALAYLEQNYFNFTAKPYEGVPTGLKLISAQNYRAEVEAVAREIRTLCREQGYLYRDIGVLVRDYSHYDLLIETVFADYDIPYFIDRKRGVLHHPLVELIRSALEVVERNWLYEPVFRYLKTDLAPVSRQQVDRLENYVLAYGIKGSLWYQAEAWQHGRDEESLPVDDIRRQAVAQLVTFYHKVKKGGTVTQLTTALFELLQDLQVAQSLEQWALEAEQQGRLETAREHSQIWDDIVNILDEMVETLGDEELTLDIYSKVLEAGLENLTMGLIPPGLDQVLVGSLERTKNPNLKAVFVVGVGDGILPARPTSSGLFNDSERKFLKEQGVELAGDSRYKLLHELFLIYTALSTASHHLYLSYPLGDSEGQALRPSSVIKRVQQLFPQLPAEHVSIEPSLGEELAYISHIPQTVAYLGKKLQLLKQGESISSLWWEVYNYLLTREGAKEHLSRLIDGLFHQNQGGPISPKTARRLFGNPLRASVSRLERYQACPFAHFLSNGLGLKERKIYQLTYPDVGQFFHAAMEMLARKLEQQKLDWAQVDQDRCAELVNETVSELAPKLQSEILLSSARHRYLTGKFKRTVHRAATLLVEHARRGKFRPVGMEVAFGPDKKLPGLKFTLADGSEMQLEGRIDRVDGCAQQDKYYLRVIDYKSGSTGLSLYEVYYGLKVQLITYLDILLEQAQLLVGQSNLQAAGLLYFYLRDPLIRAQGPLSEQELADQIIKELRMKGLVLADLEVFQLMDAQTTGGNSPIIPVGINKEGSRLLNEGEIPPDVDPTALFYKGSSVVLPEQLDLLRSHVRKLLVSAGEAILAGDTAISPYSLEKITACDYCVFHMVCQFDPTVENNSYRQLSKLNDDRVWAKLQGGDQ